MADILDLAIVSHIPDPTIAELYHDNGPLVGSYANPQVGEEMPAKYRRNYGLLLWQKGYDVSMDFAYDWSINNIWDDFDHTMYRDHNFVYPTTNGVIDTVQWEGFREGVDDLRYLTLPLNLLDERGTCCEEHPRSDCCPTTVYSAYLYVQNLKKDGLDPEALDTIRARIVDFILWFLDNSGAYDGWFIEALDGAAANTVSTVSHFVVNDIQIDKTIQMATPRMGFATGDAYHLYANRKMPTFAAGKYHGAVWLDGADDYVQLGSGAPSLSQLTGDGLTIAGWIAPALPSSQQRIITKNGPFTLGLSANMLVGSIYANGTWARVTGHTPITADQWVHVAMVYDGSQVILYADGIADGSVPQTGDLEGSGCVQIGRGNNGGCYGDPGSYFQGGIDDLFIYNRGLSASEVRALARSHVQDVTREITGLAAGTYTFSAYSKDIDGNVVQTEIRTVHVSP